MPPRRLSRLARWLSPPVLAVLALLVALAGPASAAARPPAPAAPATTAGSTAATTAGSTAAGLSQAFAAARHLPAAEVGGVRAGTLHTGTTGGAQWAVASFTPARSATAQQAAGFQDGTASGVFEQAGGSWHLVRTGLYGCADGLPAALRTAWGLGRPAACTTSSPVQSAEAGRALATLPAAARAAAGSAGHPAASAADRGQAIAAIALSQVGISDTPVVPGFDGVDCDPYSTMVAGFSANSDGCGYDSTYHLENSNETWCSDFAKWVWQRAGVTAGMNTLNAAASSFYTWATQQGQDPQPDSGTPQAGDAIMFFSPGAFPAVADHVGIVTSVNSDGTVNMVNGDFAAVPDVHVEYDTNISLTSWAAGVWGAGEQWAIVAPPSGAQPPVPAGHLSAPKTAVAGTAGSFHASGTVTGGSVTGYYWTFGDGRTTNATGADVTHVFSEAGTYPATVTITSSFGTIETLTQDVTVTGPSAAVVSVPDNGSWYDTLPVLQYTFARSAGGLAVDTWDGGSWLQLAVPGDPSATGNLAALSYPDPANADAMTPHAYYRAAGGSLAQTSLAPSGWTTQELPGTPATGSAIVATSTTSGYPEVFFVNASDQLAVTAGSPAGWTTRTLSPAALAPASLALADSVGGPRVFAAGTGGRLTVTSQAGPAWVTRPLTATVARGSSLAAATTPGGQAEVFYTAATGTLAEATQAGPRWAVSRLPGAPAASGGLAATTYLKPSALPAAPGDFIQPPGTLTDSTEPSPLGTEVFYLTASGAPAVTYDAGAGWQAETLPGTADSVLGASAYPVAEEPSELFLATASGPAEETTGARSGDPAGPWGPAQALPGAPATFAERVVLYAADPASASSAQAAAAAAGLPATQVTTSFAVAWADTLSGNYLVLAVGSPAVGALYTNACGWANPSALPAGSTPFSYILGPADSTPGAGTYVDATGLTAASTQALATDLAYYALHGSLPPGVTSLPAAAGPSGTCAGSPG